MRSSPKKAEAAILRNRINTFMRVGGVVMYYPLKKDTSLGKYKVHHVEERWPGSTL